MDENILPAAPPEKKPSLRDRVPQWARVLLQILSLLLCIALVASLLATTLVADLRQLLHADTLQQLLKTAFSSMVEAEVEAAPADPGIETDDSLITWVHEELNETLGTENEIPKEAVQTFFRESTVLDYLAEQTGLAVSEVLALGYIQSELLTEEDLHRLVVENRELLKEQFHVEITDEQVEQVVQSVRDSLNEAGGLNQILQESVAEVLEKEEPVLLGMTAAELMSVLLTIASNSLWWSVLGILLALLALLAAANFYNLPAATTWAALPMLLVGGLLTAALSLAKSLAATLPEENADMVPLLETCIGRITPVHYGVLICGAVLLLGGILWRILRAALQNRPTPVPEQ